MTTGEQRLTITPVPYTHPEARRLTAAALADLAARYGGDGDATPIEPEQFSPPRGIFLVAWLDGVAVGCGGWRSPDQDSETHAGIDAAKDAEIKRMYTAPEARGRGVARAVLSALEDSARRAGRRRMVLVTGDRQPEAIGLYESRGYRTIPNFGYYADAPGATCYGRGLAVTNVRPGRPSRP